MHPRAHDIALRLAAAEVTRQPIGRPTDDFGDLTVDDAYAIQGITMARRKVMGLHNRPARRVGRKIGITSKAVQDWLKVDQPDFGELLDDMQVGNGESIVRASLLSPRVEGEVAFVLGADLAGEGVGSADVLRATAFVVPAIEIIDSRVRDWQITYRDTVADNASSARFVLGTQPRTLEGLDLPLCGCALRKNGRVASTGAGAACLGDPVNAVVWLARTLARLGDPLRAGEVVLSGALGPVVPVEAGDFIEVEVGHIGRAAVRFV
jgi:2-oxopent-4-enoate hydratase